MSHTPGPWNVYALDWRSVEAMGRVVADVRTSDDDARLIAAAPDLLAALEQVVALAGGVVVREPGLLAECRAAIARARGEA